MADLIPRNCPCGVDCYRAECTDTYCWIWSSPNVEHKVIDPKVSEIRIATVELERELQKVVGAALDRFKERIGFLPSSIDVEFIDIKKLGEPPERILGQVSARVEI